MINWFKKIIIRSLPFPIRRKLFHPMLVPNDYRQEFNLVESILVMRHNNKNLDDEFWAAALRKYAHILDKGLQRCDFQPGHSNEFYQFAITALDNIKTKEMRQDPSVIWAVNKICEFEHLQKNECKNESLLPPVTKTICHYDDLVDAIKTRRSIRNFSNKPLLSSDIEKIVEVINWSPSSCNRQTARVFIADSEDLVKKCMKVNDGATGFSEYVPCFMSFCSDLRAYDMPIEMTLPFIDIALGIQNCCLVAHSLGVGMTILNWTHHREDQERQLRSLLGIPKYYRIIANAVLGYPDKGAPTPARKSDKLTYAFVGKRGNKNKVNQ